jgi:hypothetical protein
MAKNRNIPSIGDPFFTLVRKSFTKKLQILSDSSYFNTLSYIGVDATKCMNVGFTDDTMTEVIINKGYKNNPEDKQDQSVLVPAEEPKGTKRDSTSIFVNEAEANAIAIEMNKQLQEECKAVLDSIGAIYHEYGNVIGALKGAK